MRSDFIMRVVLDRHVWRQGGGPSQLEGPLGLSQGPHAVQGLHPRHSRNGPTMNLPLSPFSQLGCAVQMRLPHVCAVKHSQAQCPYHLSFKVSSQDVLGMYIQTSTSRLQAQS